MLNFLDIALPLAAASLYVVGSLLLKKPAPQRALQPSDELRNGDQHTALEDSGVMDHRRNADVVMSNGENIQIMQTKYHSDEVIFGITARKISPVQKQHNVYIVEKDDISTVTENNHLKEFSEDLASWSPSQSPLN